MNMLNKLARIFLFLFGVGLIALGVALSTKASLGTSPISAIPYSISLYFDFISFGSWVVIFNLSLVLIEWVLLRGTISKANILIQAILAFVFGYAIDLFMYLLRDFNPVIYSHQILCVLLGCLILAMGVCLDVIANVSVLPGDGFVLAVATKTKIDFGKIRLYSDVTMSLVAVVICMALLGKLSGVREGTAIAAIATGNFVLLLMKAYHKIMPEKH